MTTSHANCDHEATKAARLACRKIRAQRAALAVDIADYFERCELTQGFVGHDWLLRGARVFADYEGSDHLEAAAALLDYFYPADPAKREYKARNGYIITESPVNMRHTILRRFS